MHKLNRLAAKAAEYTGHVISLLASENEGVEGGVWNTGGFLTRLPIAVLTRPLSSWLVARARRSLRSARCDRSFRQRALAHSRAQTDPRDTDCLANDVIAANRASLEARETAFDPANFTLPANAAAHHPRVDPIRFAL